MKWEKEGSCREEMGGKRALRFGGDELMEGRECVVGLFVGLMGGGLIF